MNFSKLKKVYIIAEAGVNHNGSLKKALQMIKLAKKAGADAIKFQSFSADNLALKQTPKTKYQKKNLGSNISHHEMLKKLELQENQFEFLIKECKRYSIDFLSTPYDIENAKFLLKKKVKAIKVASADLVDVFLHKFLSSKNCSVILSTGMANMSEIMQTLKFYKNFKKNKISLLHCVSNYPCSNSSLNMNGIYVLKKLGYEVGFSDHTNNDVASILSISMGCKIIEKHFTIDKKLSGPDHKASLNFLELKRFINNIRIAEKSLGKKIKRCQKEEIDMRNVSRKSLVSTKFIKKGNKISLDDIKLMRPGRGISPLKLNDVLNKIAIQNITPDTIINFKMIK